MEKLDNTTEVNVSASSGFSEMFNPVNNYLYKGNPVVLITLTVIMLMYYLLFRTLGSGETGIVDRPMPETPGTSFLEVLMWGIFIFLILINGLQYFFSIDAKAAVRNLFSEKPELDITVASEEEIKSKPVLKSEEVFHIPKNIYTFEDAKSLCKAYDSRLATFDEVNKAYNSGAEWCTYGWTDGQMALYPTQKNTWDTYQKIDGHEHDCGRPGINGGYIKNPNVRFGVNCFGSKPRIRPEEEAKLGESPFPLSPEEKEADAKVEFYKKHIPDIMLSPFNYDKWASI
tara:strand:- start:1418 stop:2275 length:858 start_codon:yes stop_codon:yes gene_type:complete